MKEIDPAQVEVQILGRILEGRGQIKSSLEDSRLPQIAEALKHCARLIEEPYLSSCGDGREVLRLASGRPGRLRTRKFGASVSPFNMGALSNQQFLNGLSRAGSAEELYDACDQTSISIGNQPSGHFDCGAGGGVVDHNRTVSEMEIDSPNGQAVAFMAQTLNPSISQEAAASHMTAIRPQAGVWAGIMEAKGWSGARYAARLAERNGDSVEVLQTDESPLHGHAEEFIVLTISDVDQDGRPLMGFDKKEVKKRTGLEYFGVDLSELVRDANYLGQDEGSRARPLVAGLAHHVSVADHLTDGSLPVLLSRIRQK